MATRLSTENSTSPDTRIVVVPGPIIVGGGPSGLAVAASLARMAVPAVILERSDGIADLWRNRMYDRLSLHLPRHFCELPHLPFPPHYPTYASKAHFLHYLHSYTHHFNLHPLLNHLVTSAHFDATTALWRVTVVRRHAVSYLLSTSESADSASGKCHSEPGESPAETEVVEYVSRWLVVATGENAEPAVPEMKGREVFKGRILHSSEYKTGVGFKEKRVLVVGCGNSGMEICLDLCKHGALPFMSVRSGVHVLPREMLGKSSFGLAMKLLKWLPVRLVDRLLLMVAKMIIGDTEKYGLKRPKLGPIELKNTTGKTPVLDVGAFSFIRDGTIKIVAEVESLTSNGAKFVDGKEIGFDTVVLATGYKSNVPSWLKEFDFSYEDGKPKNQFNNGWKGENGLYCVGFSGRGLQGAGADAVKVAMDIAKRWKNN